MARKTWSLVLFGAGFVNTLLAFLPGNAMRWFDWMLVPCCVLCGLLIRKPMIPKTRGTGHFSHY